MPTIDADCEHGLSAALCAGPGHYPDDDRGYVPAATEADAHREWHRNAGVPIGEYGGFCPWDACGHGLDMQYEAEAAAQEDPDAADASAAAYWGAEAIRQAPPHPWGGDEPPF